MCAFVGGLGVASGVALRACWSCCFCCWLQKLGGGGAQRSQDVQPLQPSTSLLRCGSASIPRVHPLLPALIPCFCELNQAPPLPQIYRLAELSFGLFTRIPPSFVDVEVSAISARRTDSPRPGFAASRSLTQELSGNTRHPVSAPCSWG